MHSSIHQKHQNKNKNKKHSVKTKNTAIKPALFIETETPLGICIIIKEKKSFKKFYWCLVGLERPTTMFLERPAGVSVEETRGGLCGRDPGGETHDRSLERPTPGSLQTLAWVSWDPVRGSLETHVDSDWRESEEERRRRKKEKGR
jgi:hypothetical protein